MSYDSFPSLVVKRENLLYKMVQFYNLPTHYQITNRIILLHIIEINVHK